MNRLSIKLRVTLWYTLVLIVIAATALFATASVSRGIVERDCREKVVRSVSDFSRRFGGMGGRSKKLPEFHFFEQGVHIALYDDDHNLTGGFMPFEFSDDVELKDDYFEKISHDGDRYLVYVKRAESRENTAPWIMGVISLGDEGRMYESVIKTNVLLMGLLIIAASAGGYLLLRQALKPVDRISRTAREISESRDLSQRIALGKGNDEIYRLGATFDEMLDKIESTLENEKQFTSDASHELRTPVAVINSECEYVLDCVNTIDEAKESVEAIKNQSDKMTKLISQLLTISRMDRNTVKTEFEDTDISELLSFVCDEQEEIQKKNIWLIRQIEEKVTGKADRGLLTRLFVNLISNAYQYGKENGCIIVTLEKNGDKIQFSVKDDGIGIAEEDLPKIWERFYRADPARDSESGSMGLGLAMVKSIAKCHEGDVTVKSEPGKGTTFTFIMPAERSDEI